MSLSVIAAAPSIHHEAIDWARRASANGGTISTTVLRAVSDFCAAADRDAFRSAMYRVNLFCGGTLAGCLVPLYRGPTFGGTNFGNATDTNNNFVSADFTETGATGGLKGNGTNKLLIPGLLVSNSVIPANSIHMGAPAINLETTSNRALIGGQEGSGAFRGAVLWNSYTFVAGGPWRRFEVNGSTAATASTFRPISSTASHLIGSLSGTSSVLTENGSVMASTTLASPPGEFSNVTAASIFVFARGNVGQFATSARLRGYHCGTALSAQQTSDVVAAFARFNAALGR